HGIKRGRSRRRAETVPGVRSAGDAELDAAVPAPGGLVGALHRGRALAEAHDLEPRARNAEVLEVLARRVGAALAEREVVLLAAALVGVALDDHGPPLAAVLDRARVRLQRRARVRADVVAVVVEVDARELAHLLRLAVAVAGRADAAPGVELARADAAAIAGLVRGARPLLGAAGRRQRQRERERPDADRDPAAGSPLRPATPRRAVPDGSAPDRFAPDGLVPARVHRRNPTPVVPVRAELDARSLERVCRPRNGALDGARRFRFEARRARPTA